MCGAIFIYIYIYVVVFDNGVLFPFSFVRNAPGHALKNGVRSIRCPESPYSYSVSLSSAAHQLWQQVREKSGIVLGHDAENETLENRFLVFHLRNRLLGSRRCEAGIL